MPVQYSNRLQEILGIQSDGVSAQTHAAMRKSGVEGNDTPPPAPVTNQQNTPDSFAESYIKHFGQEKYNAYQAKHNEQLQKLLNKREHDLTKDIPSE